MRVVIEALRFDQVDGGFYRRESDQQLVIDVLRADPLNESLPVGQLALEIGDGHSTRCHGRKKSGDQSFTFGHSCLPSWAEYVIEVYRFWICHQLISVSVSRRRPPCCQTSLSGFVVVGNDTVRAKAAVCAKIFGRPKVITLGAAGHLARFDLGAFNYIRRSVTNGASAYRDAQVVICRHPDFKSGDHCPGPLYGDHLYADITNEN